MSSREGTSSNVSVQGKLRHREKMAELQDKTDRAKLMADPVFRRFLYRVVYIACDLNGVYPGQDSGIYRHEGARAVGAYLTELMKRENAAQWAVMLNERAAAEAVEEQFRNAALTEKAEPENDHG